MNLIELNDKVDALQKKIQGISREKNKLIKDYLGDIRSWKKSQPEIGEVVEMTYIYPKEGTYGEYAVPYRVIVGYYRNYADKVILKSVVGGGDITTPKRAGVAWRPLPSDIKHLFFSEQDIERAVRAELKKKDKKTLITELLNKDDRKSKSMLEYLMKHWNGFR